LKSTAFRLYCADILSKSSFNWSSEKLITDLGSIDNEKSVAGLATAVGLAADAAGAVVCASLELTAKNDAERIRMVRQTDLVRIFTLLEK
jgi:hypothetical protein